MLRTPGATREEKAVRDKSLGLLEYVGLGGHAGELAKNLPYGSQRRLEIARAWPPSRRCSSSTSRRPA